MPQLRSKCNFDKKANNFFTTDFKQFKTIPQNTREQIPQITVRNILIIAEFTLKIYIIYMSTITHEELGGGMTLPVLQQLQGVAKENFAVVKIGRYAWNR